MIYVEDYYKSRQGMSKWRANIYAKQSRKGQEIIFQISIFSVCIYRDVYIVRSRKI